MDLRIARQIALAAAALAVSACGAQSVGASSAPAITYNMERTATGKTQNALQLGYPKNMGYKLRLAGTSLAADVPLQEFIAFQDKIELSYQDVGNYAVQLDVVEKDGTPYFSDTLKWVYSTEVPDPPIVSFTQEATSSVNATMTIAATRKSISNEIWASGDLQGEHASGVWDSLSDSNLYLVQLTPGDGLKTMSVKLRNIYGNESAPVTASILKKSVGPTDCNAEMSGAGSATRTINVQLYATNTGPLYYDVVGDVESVTDFAGFTSGDSVSVLLSAGAGRKNITVKIRDAANNYCADIKRTVMVSGDYVGQTLGIQGSPLWTELGTVNLQLQYDHYASDEPIQMELSGDIYGANVGTWLPYATTATVTLIPGSGLKKVFARFRDKSLVETFLVEQQVFLSPQVTVTDAAPFKNISVSHVPGLADVSIGGCAETFSKVAYQASYRCTLAAAQIAVQFDFSDGTTLTQAVTP